MANQRKENNVEKYILVGYNAVALTFWQ